MVTAVVVVVAVNAVPPASPAVWNNPGLGGFAVVVAADGLSLRDGCFSLPEVAAFAAVGVAMLVVPLPSLEELSSCALTNLLSGVDSADDIYVFLLLEGFLLLAVAFILEFSLSLHC